MSIDKPLDNKRLFLFPAQAVFIPIRINSLLIRFTGENME